MITSSTDPIKSTEEMTARDAVNLLTQKQIEIPSWADKLEREYNPLKHPVFDRATYPDIVTEEGVERVSRIPLPYQQLAARRLTEMCFAIPPTIEWDTHGDDDEAEVARVIESVLARNFYDALNIKRGNLLYSSCEIMTLWYLVPSANTLYGVESNYKLRSQTFSPSTGAKIYPIFDEVTGDLTALSVMSETTTKSGPNDTIRKTRILDAYTADLHVRYKTDQTAGGWEEVEREPILTGKIPAVYRWRATPAWEEHSNLVYEMEWTLSRNANYLRKNSRPLLMVKAGTVIDFGQEPREVKASRTVFQTPIDGDMSYVTWQQPIEPLKYQMDTLRQEFFTLLQLPDLSYSNLRNNVLSGEAMKQMLTDAALKVGDESGDWIEFLTREISVIKSLLPHIMGKRYATAINSLGVEITLNPYVKADEGADIRNIATAVQNKLISREEGIRKLGWSKDVAETERKILEEAQADAMEPAF